MCFRALLALVVSSTTAMAAGVTAKRPVAPPPPPPATKPAVAATPAPATRPAAISGVHSHLATVTATNSESGIGALAVWAGKLWYVPYPVYGGLPHGEAGLFEVDENLNVRKRPAAGSGATANRMVHEESQQLIIGPYFIGINGAVRTCKGLLGRRVTATTRHLTDPANKVYCLTIEGTLLEVDVRSLETKEVATISHELGIRSEAHFKAAQVAQGRLIVANNTYTDVDQKGAAGSGRLAEWDGKTWTILERTAFFEVEESRAGGPVFAVGWDRKSVLLKVLNAGKWATYRLPKGSQAHNHGYCTEWPRTREIAPGRLMMDAHGTFFEIAADFGTGRTDGLKPLAGHLRQCPDFCIWNGKLVLAGNENVSKNFANPYAGQPQSNLWIGRPEDLAKFGRPAGWGAVWRQEMVKAGQMSDPFLVNGFDKRVVHLSVESEGDARLAVEIDAEGDGTWKRQRVVKVSGPGYAHYVFPADVKACWVRLVAMTECKATAQFVVSSGPGEVASEGIAGFSPVERAAPQISGALMPWADRLWFTAYGTNPADKTAVTGLYEIDAYLRVQRRGESVPGQFSNRLVLNGRQLIVGPYVIDAQGGIKRIKGLENRNITAVMAHPRERQTRALFLSGEGMLYEADLTTLEAKGVINLRKELGIKGAPRFKAGYTAGDHAVIAACADGKDDEEADGRLAEWDGRGWTIIERKPFCEVVKAGSMSSAVIATGWDRASALLKVRLGDKWTTYRLPKLTDAYDTAWTEGWPRTREVETERLLVDCHGLLYEMSELFYGGKVWGLRPIAAHGGRLTEFCSWRGMLVMAGLDADAKEDAHVRATEHVPLWFGTTDDLWRFGKPRGRGGPWMETKVEAGAPSDAYLMTGFDRKRLTISHDSGEEVEFKIEVDYLGMGEWQTYRVQRVANGQKWEHQFPAGFGAHWVRLTANAPCKATAMLVYE